MDPISSFLLKKLRQDLNFLPGRASGHFTTDRDEAGSSERIVDEDSISSLFPRKEQMNNELNEKNSNSNINSLSFILYYIA